METRDLHKKEEVAQAVDRYTAETIPVHASLRVKETVFSQPEVERLLAESRLVALGVCGCRKEKKKCAGPLDVCITLNEAAEEAIARGTARAVRLPQALSALHRSHEAGLVHLAYRQGDEGVSVLCSCCSCCCWFLNALKRFDYHDAIAESAFVARFDEAQCAGCRTCVNRCPFGAWEGSKTHSEKVSFSAARCFGCGLCASTCPTGAISLVGREETDE